MEERNFDRALQLRDSEFKDLLKIYEYITLPPTQVDQLQNKVLINANIR